MVAPVHARAASRTRWLLLGLLIAAAPAPATAGPRARLIHCGETTCLSITGHRPNSDTAVQIAGNALTVSGGRAWRATVPLETARDWTRARGDRVTVTLVDPQSGSERSEVVMLPPGALGKRIELASLIINAH